MKAKVYFEIEWVFSNGERRRRRPERRYTTEGEARKALARTMPITPDADQGHGYKVVRVTRKVLDP